MNIRCLKYYRYIEFARSLGLVEGSFLSKESDLINDYWKSLPTSDNIDMAKYEKFAKIKRKNKLTKQIIHLFFEDNIKEYASRSFLQYIERHKTQGLKLRELLKRYNKLIFYNNR